jgi:hypothetical protein
MSTINRRNLFNLILNKFKINQDPKTCYFENIPVRYLKQESIKAIKGLKIRVLRIE